MYIRVMNQILNVILHWNSMFKRNKSNNNDVLSVKYSCIQKEFSLYWISLYGSKKMYKDCVIILSTSSGFCERTVSYCTQYKITSTFLKELLDFSFRVLLLRTTKRTSPFYSYFVTDKFCIFIVSNVVWPTF